MSTEALGSLDASEQAYFENQGATEIEPQEPTAETPAEEPTGEAAAEPEKGEPQSKEQKTVPLAALHEERQRNREMRQRMQALEEQTRIGNERLQQLFQARQPQPQIPAFEQDPATNLHTRLTGIEQFAMQQHQQQQAQAQRARTIEMLQQETAAQEAEYREINPEYDKAVEFLTAQEAQSLQAMGYPPAQIAPMLQNKLAGLAWELRQSGRNVPDTVYKLAQSRGFRNAPAMTAQQKMQQTQKGVAAAKSLGSSGGAGNGLSLAALAEMPAEEFAELTKDDKAWRKLMGG